MRSSPALTKGMGSERKTEVIHTRSEFWREWGPAFACALLTGIGGYWLLALATVPLMAMAVFALALGCPLAAGLMWWLESKQS